MDICSPRNPDQSTAEKIVIPFEAFQYSSFTWRFTQSKKKVFRARNHTDFMHTPYTNTTLFSQTLFTIFTRVDPVEFLST